MSRTIAGSYSAGITLTSIADNPLSVSGIILASGSPALAAFSYGWSIDNAGTIASYGSVGVYLGAPGSLATGAAISNEPGGTISGDPYGVVIAGGGTVSNPGGGLISGGGGVAFKYGVGTLINGGLIAGTAGVAVQFATPDPGNRLIAQPGAAFYGNVDGGAGVLELASGSGAIGSIGAGITNFSALVFDSGAQWTVAGTGDSAGLGTVDIVGFTAGDTIDLTGFTALYDHFANNALTLTDAATNQVTLQVEGTFASDGFAFSSDGAGGTDITLGASIGPPVVAGTYPNQSVLDNATLQPFAVATIADPNAAAVDSVAITLLVNGVPSDSNGTLSGPHLTRTGVGSYTLAPDSAANVSDELQALVFTPTAHEVTPGSAVTTDVTLSVSDGLSGAATEDSNTSVVATAVNDPPTISGTRAGQMLAPASSDHPFGAVSISDPDFGATESVTITLLANGVASDANGTLSGAGLVHTGTGSYELPNASPDAATAILRALSFTPPPLAGATSTTVMQIGVSDGIIAQPVTDATTSVIATEPSAPPVISGIRVSQSMAGDGSSTAPFADVSVNDAGAGGAGSDTLTITLSDPALGRFGNLGTGSFDASNGVYSLIGTPDAINAALRTLTFEPAPPSEGYVSTADFAISVSGAGGASSQNTSLTSVRQVLGLAAIPSSLLSISSSPDGSGFSAAQIGMTNEAVVTAPSSDIAYVLPGGYQAEFLGGSASSALGDSVVGNAVLVGNNGNDSISGTAGNDSIVAGNGNNTLTGGAGAVAIIAGNGDNLINAADATSFSIAGGNGNDTITANGVGTVQGGSGGNLMFGSDGATIASAGSQDTVAALGGSVTARADGKAPIVFGNFHDAGASLSAIVSGSQATVSAGIAPITLTTTGGDAIVFGGFGSTASNLRVVARGSNTTIAGGGSNTSATLAGSTTLVFGSFDAAATLNVTDAGSNDTISTGNSVATITAATNSSSLLVFGGSGTLDFAGSSNAATIVAGSGAASISGGGAMTLYGGAGNVMQLSGGGSVLYDAGGGTEALDAGGFSGAIEAIGGSGPDTLLGGAGNDTLFAGAGAMTLGGGAGMNTFAFASSLTNGSADIVLDFTPNDLVSLTGYGANAAALALEDAVSRAGSTTIALSDNTRITFLNIASASALQGRIVSG